MPSSTKPIDTTPGSAPTEVHLLALIHGMWGQPAHLARFAEVMREIHGDTPKNGIRELDVLVAETNRENHTYDGVDWGAERVVKEIHNRINAIEKQNKKVTRFSLVGYSLGGLLSRYAIGILNSQGFFDKVTPVNFATVATPNIGLLVYPTFVSRLFRMLGPTFLSRTGEHFYATDVWEGVDASQKKPLLEVMSEKGGVFYDGLAKFKHVTIYANVINDRTVPFITAAIEPYDPFVAYARTGLEIDLDEKYPPLIKAYHLPEGPPPENPPAPRLFSKEWLLESTEGAGNRSTIMQVMRNIERGVEDTVVELMEDDVVKEAEVMLGVNGGIESRASTPTEGATTPMLPIEEEPPTDLVSKPAATSSSLRHRRRVSITYTPSSDPHSPYYSRRASIPPLPSRDLISRGPASTDQKSLENQPILSPAQLRMIRNLNALPNLRKEFVFLDNLRNSHATIVCRDLKQFAFHRRGEGVLRNFADGFEV
ncbi:hypothetical protein FRB97_006808 [Tulasnella sp. 331]|nr:hypothetical protein FRB97_006808 [Tulasnella sp. 331]